MRASHATLITSIGALHLDSEALEETKVPRCILKHDPLMELVTTNMLGILAVHELKTSFNVPIEDLFHGGRCYHSYISSWRIHSVASSRPRGRGLAKPRPMVVPRADGLYFYVGAVRFGGFARFSLHTAASHARAMLIIDRLAVMVLQTKRDSEHWHDHRVGARWTSRDGERDDADLADLALC
ncbi:hypothetical protein EJB05_30735, partial [Eragrostis curvula]